MKIDKFKKIKLPDKPGVYFFKKNSQILYVGKATSLRDRVRSYMSKDIFDMRGLLIEKMVSEANKIDWQETDSVLEALILEATFIKKYQPYYNTKEKDDKSFNYVCITRETLPKVVIVRGSNLKSMQTNVQNVQSRTLHIDKVYGPFTNGSQLKEAVKIIRKIFPFLDDKSKNYLEFYKQINLVPDLEDRKLYLQNIKNIKLFFEGKKKKIIFNLKKEMSVYAKNKEFEKAGEIKRQIFAIQHINDIALIKNESIRGNKIFLSEGPALSPIMRPKKGAGRKILLPLELFRIEAYDIAHMGGKNMVGVMTVVVDGEVEKGKYKKFKIKTQENTNDTGALKEILERRFAHTEWTYPDLIVLDGGMAQFNTGKQVLKKFKIGIALVSVVKDERHKPKAIMGDERVVEQHKKAILIANSEAHRFAITYHKKMRGKNFLK